MADVISTALSEAIKRLEAEKAMFTLEADFQFSLAWKLKEILGETAKIILEYPYCEKEGTRIKYIDIYVDTPNEISFIELKYKTKTQKITRYGIDLTLKNHSAQDFERLLFVQDIERLEGVRNRTSKKMNNYCLFLTNDKVYWKKGKNKENKENEKKRETIDEKFYLAENIEAGPKVFSPKNDKYKKEVSTNEYECHWCNYLDDFKLLMIKVKPSER